MQHSHSSCQNKSCCRMTALTFSSSLHLWLISKFWGGKKKTCISQAALWPHPLTFKMLFSCEHHALLQHELTITVKLALVMVKKYVLLTFVTQFWRHLLRSPFNLANENTRCSTTGYLIWLGISSCHESMFHKRCWNSSLVYTYYQQNKFAVW